jgi:phage protein D
MPEGDFSLEATIQIDGTALPEALHPMLEAVVVDDHLHLPATFQLTFRDIDLTVLKTAGIRIGSRIVIDGSALGEARATPLVTGEVTGIEAEYDAMGGRAIVRGYDPSHRLHRGRRTETYRNVTDSDIARTVARRAGVAIGTIDPSTATHDHVSQANISDWEFLKARARAINYQVSFEDGKLQFRKPSEAGGAPSISDFGSTDPLQLVMGQDLSEFRPRITSAAQVGEVEVRAWDQVNKKVMVATSRATATGAKLSTDPGRLAQTFGSARTVSTHRPMDSQSSVEAAAQALGEHVGSVFAEATGTCRGTPTLRAGTPFSVSVVGDDFEGQYVATTTRHVFDRDGYRTEFTVSGQHDRSLLGLVGASSASGTTHAGRVYGVMVAVVTGLDDPLNLGRVTIQLPTLAGQYESDWARTVHPGASKASGTVFLPDVGDEVLVAFEDGDVSRPYVLGGLWSAPHPPPLGQSLFDNGHVKRQGIVSRKNHRLVFLDDDNDSGVAIMTGDGKLRIALKSTGTEIHVFADGKIVIEAKQDIEITGKQAISVEAQGQLTLKGQAGVKIQSSGIVDIDGSMIQLN